ncbi:MAG: Ig-like domain repeat protein, partial [Candidatus Saccharibacteria bacterium]|nr:Ig-like domain repeat protein [Candidatus Saccharibacteria bacterium]
VWLKNSNNETASKSFEVSKIDKDAPVIQTALKASDITEDSFKLSIAVIENGSGIKKIEWKYKLDEDDEYTTVTDDFSSSAGSASVLSTTKSHVFTNVESGEYNAYAIIYDYAGNSVTGDKLNFTISEEGGEFGGETLVDETQQPTATQTGATTNPKTDNQSVLPVSLAGGAFVLLGAAVAIRRRR